MARGRIVEDLTTLQMALIGYELERTKIEDKIKLLQRQLKGKKAVLAPDGAAKKPTGTKREFSPAARRRIAAAQRKRWADIPSARRLPLKRE